MRGFLSSSKHILLVSLTCFATLCPSSSTVIGLAAEPTEVIEPGTSNSMAVSDQETLSESVGGYDQVISPSADFRTLPLKTYARIPMSFTPNKGQFNEQVRYHAQFGSHSLWFTADGVSLALPHTTLRLIFLDADPAVRIEGDSRLPGKVNYLIGDDPTGWWTDIATYDRVAYRNLWPGVDLVYEGKPNLLKSTFTIAPGADPAQIQLAYPDADSLTVDQQGHLIITVAGQELRESPPLAWQKIDEQHVPVAVTYQLIGQASYTFALPEGYDPTYPLVIDPEFRAAFLGGFATAVAADGSGGVYVTGQVDSPEFPATGGAFDTTCGTDGQCNRDGGSPRADVFVAKLKADGTGLAYATFIGGSGTESSNAIAVDQEGNAYVVGKTNSADFPATFSRRSGGVLPDVFVVKLTPDGTAMPYGAVIGSTGMDYGYDVAVDGEGAAYITGYTASPDFPTTPGAFDVTFSEGSYDDVYVLKMNAAGSDLAYSTFLGGSATDHGYGVAVNERGEAYVTGDTMSTDFPTTQGAFQTQVRNVPLDDAFVAKLAADGRALIYSTLLGGLLNERGQDIAVDGAGNAYVTGWTESEDFPVTRGSFDTTYSGSYDAFVAKVNGDGTGLDYATFLGGRKKEFGYGIAVSGDDKAYLTGATNSDDFPVTDGAFDTAFNGNSDGFVVKMSIDGTGLEYATFLGGSQDDQGTCVDIESEGNAYVTLSTASEDFPTTGVIFVDMSSSLTRTLPSPAPQEPPPDWNGDPPEEPYAIANFDAIHSEKHGYIDYLSHPTFRLETLPITVAAPGFDETRAIELSDKLQADYERYLAEEFSPEDIAAFDRQSSAFSRLTQVERAYSELYPMYITTTGDVARSMLYMTIMVFEFKNNLDNSDVINLPFGEALKKFEERQVKLVMDGVNYAFNLAIDRLPQGETQETFKESWKWIFRFSKLAIQAQKEETVFIDIFDDLMQDLGSDALQHFGLRPYISLGQPILNESTRHVYDAVDESVYQRLIHNKDQDAPRQIDFLLQGAQTQTDYLHNTMQETEKRLGLAETLEQVACMLELAVFHSQLSSLAGRIIRSSVIVYDGLESGKHLDYLRAASRESQTCAFSPADCSPPSSSSNVSVAIASSDPTFSPSYRLGAEGVLLRESQSTLSVVEYDASKTERQGFLAQQSQCLRVSIEEYLELQQQVVEAVDRGDIEATATLVPDLLDAEDDLSARFAISRAPIQAVASLPETQNETFSQAYRKLLTDGNDFSANVASFYALLMGVLASQDDRVLRQQVVDQADAVAVSIQAYQDSIDELSPTAAELPTLPKVIIEAYQITDQNITLKLVNATPASAPDVQVEVADGPEVFVGTLEAGESCETTIELDQTGFQLIEVLVGDSTTDTKIVMAEAEAQSIFAGLPAVSTIMDWVLYCSLFLIFVSGLGLVLLGGIVLARRKK